MKALGIKASCSQLVMRPEVALQRRQRNQGQQQAWIHTQRSPTQCVRRVQNKTPFIFTHFLSMSLI